ncbi:MAG: spore germination protein GerW family protein [Anaerolineaceae bacterium]|nr:spore germination protein GerW family protein [Anaerolineaceae bacterium]
MEEKMQSTGETPASFEFVTTEMDKLMAAANVEAVYGKPIHHNETIIIPASEVFAVMGVGGGSWMMKGEPSEVAEEVEAKEEGEEEKMHSGNGGGGGGGGYTFARPVALVIAGPDGVRVEPVFDRTKVALAAFTAFGFMFATMARMMSRRPRFGRM